MEAQVPNWSEHIAPILYTNCTSCHHTGGIGGFSLLTYQDALSKMYQITVKTGEREMPPWKADPKYAHYVDERVLCDDEIALIQAWFDAGGPSGDFSLAPPAPTYSGGSALGTVDLSLTIPTYTVTGTTDIYRCFALPTGITQNKFITGMEILPDNDAIVHHVLVFYDTSGDCAAQDAAASGPGYTCFGTACNSATFLGGWAPGGTPIIFPPNMGASMPANGHIVLQVHYAPNSQGQSDATSINLKLANPTGMRNITTLPPLNHYNLDEGALVIPANTVRTFHSRYTLPVNLSVLSVMPHMHMLGKSIKAFAVTPTTDTIPLVNVPKWDFGWQGTYTFPKVLKLPAGTTLYSEAVYDNTSANPNNPHNPPMQVTAGEATHDEMMIVFMSYLTYQNGDENIVLDNNADNHSCGAPFQGKLFLEGAWNGTQMTTALPTANKLPLIQPFNSHPWYYQGTERIKYNLPLNSNVTNWVLAEARTSTTQTADLLLSQRPALLYKDGTLHDMDGSMGVNFNIRPNRNYYVVVRPIGHLAVASPSAINLPNATAHDFTLNASQAMGNNQLKNINGTYCLPAGDIDHNGVINYQDYNEWTSQNMGNNLYSNADLNYNTNIDATDFTLLRPNLQAQSIPLLRY